MTRKTKEDGMENVDFRELIINQRKDKKPVNWSGTMLDYLKVVSENPEIIKPASGRVYDMIASAGVEDVDDALKVRGYEDLVSYNFFKDKIFGTHEAIHDIFKFLKASARRTETGKRILLLVGPVSSGKSTISSLIKKGIQTYDAPIYAIDGCPIHEDPLNAIPDVDRPFWEEQLGVKIQGHLCPVCAQRMDEFTDDRGYVKWEEIPVKQIVLNEQKGIGIGTFQPSDPKAQDISELIGRINMSKMTLYGETDPRAYQFDGEIQKANRGIIEYIEILKADTRFHYTLITLAQEQLIKAPGFPQMSIDTCILSHTNQTEFDAFKADKKNEALHDRIYPVYVPWNLNLNDEVKIYEKLIAESEFKDVHIAPKTLEVAAMFAILSRLKMEGSGLASPIQKMKLYNGEYISDFKKKEIDVKAIRQKGKVNGEGMSGISPRFIINALNVTLASKEDKHCINPMDVIRALRDNFDHQIGITDEEKANFLSLLISESDSVAAEYKDIAVKEVNKAFLSSYEEQAQSLFENYMTNVEAYCKNVKVEDDITGEFSDPDEALMRSVEEIIPVPEASKKEFRNGIFVHKSDVISNGREFTYEDYDPLRMAIEKKLMKDLRNVMSLTLTDKVRSSTNKKVKAKRRLAVKNLMEKGYCEHCAEALLGFVGKILRREQ